MKIIFFTNDLQFFISHRLGLATSFADNHKNKVFLITDQNSLSNQAEIKRIHNAKISLLSLNFSKNSLNPFHLFKNILSFKELFNKINPNVAFFVSAKPNIIGGLATIKNKDTKKIFSISGLGYLFINDNLKNFFLKFILFSIYKVIFKNHKVIFQNKHDLETFKKKKVVDASSAVLIEGNGIDVDIFRFIHRKNTSIKFIFASRLLIDKGIVEFINAAKAIPGNYEFIICGGFDELNPKSIKKEYFHELISSDQRIIYRGSLNREDLINEFYKANFFVLPSYREGLPQVALEAAATGLPLILSDVPGCSSCVIDQLNGFTCNARDTESLIKAFKKAVNINNYNELSFNSRKMVVERFATKKIYEEFTKIIN